MSRNIVPLGLRMPPEVKEQIERVAKANGRSMNAEIVSRLQGNGLDAFTTEALIQELSRRLGGLKITAQ